MDGMPVHEGVTSATVVAPDCETADAWATALMVLPPVKGLALADAQGLAVYLIQITESGSLEHMNDRFRALLKSTEKEMTP
jgi:thiamine biosynthesis lipoprotein